MDKEKYLCENFFLFKDLDKDSLKRIAKLDGMQQFNYKQGEIIQDTSHCDKLGMILKGKAFIRSCADGVIINKLNKNDVYGVAALFDKPTYTTIIQAVTDCSVITFDKSFIEKSILENPTVAINYIQFLSQKISFLNKKINAYTAKSAENKLYAYLLQLPRQGNVLDLHTDMATIAKMIGFGRATLYRSFDKLIKIGLITKTDKKIIFNEV